LKSTIGLDLHCPNQMTDFQAYALDFLSEDLHTYELTGDAIRVHRFVLEGWLQRTDVTSDKPLLAHVTTSLGSTRVCCIGGPHFQSREQVFIPQWIMEQLYMDVGDSVIIELITEDVLPASMIYLKPLDTAIYHTDIRECFEKKLDMFHVLEVGTVLTVEIESLGGYKVEAYVDRLEPAHVCRLGGEVGVEFLEPDGGVPEFVPASAAVDAVVDAAAVDTVVEAPAPPDYKKIQEEVRASWLKKYKKD
jgi:hypothetical protein